MADPNPEQGEDRNEGRSRDPFAELALIIGFDPREKIRGAAMSRPVEPSEDRAAAIQAPDPHRGEWSATGPDSGPQPPVEEVEPWSDAPDWHLDVDERDVSLEAPAGGQAEGSAAEDAPPAGAELLDEEGWELAVAASLDRITGEIGEHASRGPAAGDEETALDREFNEALGATFAADQLDEAQPDLPADELLDEPLALDLADWNLSEEDDALGEAAGPDTRPEQAPTEPVATVRDETVPASLGSHDDALEDIDLSAEFDLDHVLAESIERELESAWTAEMASPAGEPQGSAVAMVAMDYSTENAPAAMVEAVSEERVVEDAPALERGATAGIPAAEPRHADAPIEIAPELDFEAELTQLLTEDDEPGPSSPPSRAVPVSTGAVVAGGSAVPAMARQFSTNVPEVALAREAGAPGKSATPPAAERQQSTPKSSGAAPPDARPSLAASGPADDDPFAALAAMAARYRAGASRPAQRPAAPPVRMPAAPPRDELESEQQSPVEAMNNLRPSREDMPEIETVDVPEPAAALADDLDLPDVPQERLHSGRAPFDDLDTEFADLLQEMTEGRRAARTAPASSYQQPGWEARTPRAPMAQDFSQADMRREPHGYAAPASEDEFDGERRATAQWQDADADAEEAELAVERLEAAADEPPARSRGRRGFWLASLLAGVVLAGGMGAYAVGSGGMAITGAPALIRADAGPVKVKPKDPGGAKVPNQDNTVYRRVAGAPVEPPAQSTLVASAEEPLDLVEPVQPTPPADDLALSVEGDSIEAIVKVDERIAAAPPAAAPEAAPAEEAITVIPRKVRTMAVRADGTLVPHEEIAADAPAALVEPQVAAAQDAIRKVSGAPAPDATATGAIANVPPPAPPVQVAALAPGAWSMQIASQPSEEGARNAYGDLAQRFGGVLGNRGVNIVKAEIDGKGTFWRVRIPAESRKDAVGLCESYKAAGGSCFVSK